MSTNLEDYYLHLREGSVLPYQEAKNKKVDNTKDLENVYTDLYILPSNTTLQPAKGCASGFVYFDDGVSHVQQVARFDISVFAGTDTLDINIVTTRNGTRTNST